MRLDILEEHIDETVDLFERRLLALETQSLTRRDLVALEGRLRAHLDGLLLEPDASWQMCRRFLVKGSPGEAFVAAILALEGGVASRLQAVEDALESPSDKVRSGVQAAFDTRSHRSLTGRNPRRPA